jgi:hypothetical protein
VLAQKLEMLFFDQPWADPELPSLVYVDHNDRVKGFLGSHVRRMSFDGEQIRVACGGQLATYPDVRRQAAVAFLIREYLSRPHDLALTDTGSEAVQRIWEAFGGETAHLQCIGWVRLFRPWRFAAEFLARGRPIVQQLGRTLSRLLDPVTLGAAAPYLDVKKPKVYAERLTPKTLASELPHLAGRLRLRPDYDERFLTWMFRELAQGKGRGSPVGFLVMDGTERVLGWYLYVLLPGGISRALGIGGDRQGYDGVLDHLFHHAYAGGSAGIQGRLEPGLAEPLSRRRCIFHRSGHQVLVQSKRPEILHALASGNALLTRMDGDYWLSPLAS